MTRTSYSVVALTPPPKPPSGDASHVTHAAAKSIPEAAVTTAILLLDMESPFPCSPPSTLITWGVNTPMAAISKSGGDDGLLSKKTKNT